MKLKDIQLERFKEFKEEPNRFFPVLNRLKAQLGSDISNVLSSSVKENKEPSQNLIDDDIYDDFNMELLDIASSEPKVTNNVISTLENELKENDEKLNIFYKNDGLLSRKNTSFELKNYLDKSQSKSYMENIYHIPLINFALTYKKLLEDIVNYCNKEFPECASNTPYLINGFSAVFDHLLNIEPKEKTKRYLYKLLNLKEHLDSIKKVLADGNIENSLDKMHKHINSIATAQSNFSDYVYKNVEYSHIPSEDEIATYLFKYTLLSSIHLLKDMFKELQYTLYMQHNTLDNVLWDNIKNKITSINYIYPKIDLITKDFKYYHNSLNYLKTNNLYRSVIDNTAIFYTYNDLIISLYKIVSTEIARWINMTVASNSVLSIDLSSKTKIECKKIQSMVNSNMTKLVELNIPTPK